MKINDKSIRNRRIISTIIFSVIQLLTLISPFIMGRIIDVYIPNNKVKYVCLGIALFVAIPFVSIILQTVYNYFTIKYVRKKGNEYSIKIMKNLVYREMSFFDKENSLELLSYASKEIVDYVNFEVVELSQYYVNIILAIATFITLLTINPYLAMIQLIYLPVAKYPIKKIGGSVEKEIKEVVTKNAENNQIKGDTFKAIEYVKLNQLEKEKIGEVEKNNDAINAVWGKVAALDTLSGIWTGGFATVLFTGVTFGLGALLIMNGRGLTVGKLVSVITYCGVLYSCINSLLQTDISKAKNNSEYEKVFSFLDMEGEREDNESKVPFKMEKGIFCKNLTFSYPDKNPILKDITLSFKKGEWTGIVGPSGSGKSTLLKLMCKLYEAPRGELYVDDTDINDINAFSIRENVAKISQDIFLFPGTILENMKLVCPSATLEEINRVLDIACLSDFIARLSNGLNTDVGEAGKLISGGEKQRLSIAIGLLRKTKVLLLDEVSSSLDPETEEKLARNLHELAKEGYTIISISHKHEFLTYADKIIDFGEN